MQLAIYTDSLASNTYEALKRAAKLGFRSLEVKLQSHEFNYGYQRKPDVNFYRELRAEIESLGLNVWSVSPPDLRQEEMFSMRSRGDILKGAASAAALLQAKVFVVEPVNIFRDQEDFDRYIQNGLAPAVIPGFDESWVQIVNGKMFMALLNRDYWIGSPLTNNAQRIAQIANDLAVGCALDIPRAVSRSDIASWLQHAGERLAVAYTYDQMENGLPVAPIDDKWIDLLANVQKSRIKAIVLKTHPEQDDDEILQSRVFVESLLKK